MQTFRKRDWSHVLIVIILRVISTLTILWEPFIGSLTANLFDALDVVILSAFSTIITNRQYQILDKTLDNFILLIMFISIFLFNIIPQPYIAFAVFLFVARIIGSTTALITKVRRILLITPNFFYYYFSFFAFLHLINDYKILDNLFATNAIIFLLFAFNYSQEIVLHFIQFHPWTWTQEHILKREKID